MVDSCRPRIKWLAPSASPVVLVMNANQYRAALAKLDLTQVGAARLFGVNEATSRRWAASGVSGTVVILLRLMLAGKITAEDIDGANKK